MRKEGGEPLTKEQSEGQPNMIYVANSMGGDYANAALRFAPRLCGTLYHCPLTHNTSWPRFS